MRHLRKFNESDSENIDIDYIKSVFIDFIEDGCDVRLSSYYGISSNPNPKVCEVIILIPVMSDRERHSSTIESFIQHSDNSTNQLKDIKSCIDRVLDEYPTMDYKVGYSSYTKIIIAFSIDPDITNFPHSGSVENDNDIL